MFNPKDEINNNRKAIKPDWVKLREIKTDRILKLERPLPFKQPQEDAVIIELPFEFTELKQKTLAECIKNRRSLRKYSEAPLSFLEASYLIWETCRVNESKGNVVFRTIPTGGATNAMETYVYLNNVEGMEKALVDNKADLAKRVHEGMMHQLRGAAMVFFITAVPYRSEYKYSYTAHKMIAIEAGHAGQTLSLAAEVVDSGCVCIAAYNQELTDQLLQVDGKEEFATYIIAVGKK
jgi:hypothetical protein